MQFHHHRVRGAIGSAVLALTLALSTSASAQVYGPFEPPRVIAYDGVLELHGVGVSGTVNMRFTLDTVPEVDREGGGLWQDVYEVAVTSGRFSVLLGSQEEAPLTDEVFDATALYLAVDIDVDDTAEIAWLSLTNAQMIVPVPYAYWAGQGFDFEVNNLLVSTSATVDNDLSVGNDLDVGNNLSVTNDLDVTHDATIGNNLGVTNDLDVTHDATIDNDLVVTGNVTITGNLDLDLTSETPSQFNLIPSGAIMAFNLATCSTGWSPADGQDGRPDLRGRFPLGVGNLPNSSTPIALRSTGGSYQYHIGIQRVTRESSGSGPAIFGIAMEWNGEASVSVYNDFVNDPWTTFWSSGWRNHLPPYTGILYCVRD